MTDTERPTTAQLALRVASDAALAYSTSPAVRAVVTAIPFVSGLDALVGTAGSNIALERLRMFIEDLAGQVERFVEKQDSAVTEEELLDAAIRALRGATETGNRDKARTIAAAREHALAGPAPH